MACNFSPMQLMASGVLPCLVALHGCGESPSPIPLTPAPSLKPPTPSPPTAAPSPKLPTEPSCIASDLTKVVSTDVTGCADKSKDLEHGEPFLSAVTACVANASIASMPCAACFAWSENCRKLPNPKFEAKQYECALYYYYQSSALGQKMLDISKKCDDEESDIANAMANGSITIDQYDALNTKIIAQRDAQLKVNSALQRQLTILQGACPFANCQVQSQICTGISTAFNKKGIVAV